VDHELFEGKGTLFCFIGEKVHIDSTIKTATCYLGALLCLNSGVGCVAVVRYRVLACNTVSVCFTE